MNMKDDGDAVVELREGPCLSVPRASSLCRTSHETRVMTCWVSQTEDLR